MLKKSASGVLASFRSSMGTRPPHHSAARTDLVLLIRRTMVGGSILEFLSVLQAVPLLSWT
jgi:hypothetical protein